MCQTYFNRYDLDDSGTINNGEELVSLTINLVNANKLKLNVQEVELPINLDALLMVFVQLEAIQTPMVKRIEHGEVLTLEEFMAWFHDRAVVQSNNSSWTARRAS